MARNWHIKLYCYWLDVFTSGIALARILARVNMAEGERGRREQLGASQILVYSVLQAASQALRISLFMTYSIW